MFHNGYLINDAHLISNVFFINFNKLIRWFGLSQIEEFYKYLGVEEV